MLISSIKKGSNLIRINGKRFDLSKMTHQLIVNTEVKNATIFPVKKENEIIAIAVCIVSDTVLNLSDISHIDGFDKLLDKIKIIHRNFLPLTTGGTVDERKLIEEISGQIKNIEEVSSFLDTENNCILLKEVPDITPSIHQWDFTVNPFEGGSYIHKDDYNLDPELTKDVPLAHTIGPKFILPEGAPLTLKDALVATAKKFPERGIQFILGDGTRDFITYADLLLRAKKALTVYRSNNIKAGDTVIINTLDNRSFLEAYWGCILGGFLPTPVGAISEFTHNNAIVQRLANVWKLLKKPKIVVNQGHLEQLNAIKEIWGEEPLLGIEVERFVSATPDEDLFEATPDAPAVQLLTSGSTGVPKCIMHRNRSLVNRVWTSKIQDFGKENEVSLNFLPMDHVGGSLMFSARDIYFGYHQVNVKVDQFLENPVRLLDWIDEFKVTMTWGANFVFALVNEYEEEIQKGNWKLSTLHHIMNAAEAVTTNVCQKFLQLLQPFGLPVSAMQPSFGMSETSSCVLVNQEMRTGINFAGVAIVTKESMNGLLKLALPEEIENGVDEDKYTSLPHCGKIAAGSEARITDKQNNIIPEGVIGRLQIKGITIMNGYVDNPKANEEAFIGDGWMNTGDLGFILEGNVYITGREKDLIIINGANFLSFEIESVVDEVEGVKFTFSAATGIFDPVEEVEKLVVIYVSEKEQSIEQELETIDRIKKRVLRSFGLEASYIIPVTQKDFPKTISGKIQRAKIKNRFSANEYKETIKAIDILQKNKRTIPQWFAKPEWQLKKMSNFKAPISLRKQLLFINEDTPLDSFDISKSIYIRKGNTNTIIEENPNKEIVLDIKAPNFEIIKTLCQDEPVNEIIYFWSLSEKSALESLTCLHTILQSVQKYVDTNCRFLVIANDYGEEQHYLGNNEALIGYIKTLNSEQENIQAQLLSFDEVRKQSYVDIQAELKQPVIDEIISWRAYNRFVFKLKALDQQMLQSRFSTQRIEEFKGQTWCVTGGFGGVGRIIIPHILKKYKMNLIILGRGSLSEERTITLGKWNKIGKVRYVALNLNDKEEVENFISKEEKPVRGVLHFAGASQKQSFETPEDFTVLKQPWSYVENQLAIKVEATNNLLKALATQENNSTLILFSSVNAFFGGNGFSAYAAATSYQSGLVHQSQYSNVQVRTMDWSTWHQTGMNQDNQSTILAEKKGFMSISPFEGLISFDIALQVDEPRMLIGVDVNNKYILQETVNSNASVLPVLYTTSEETVQSLISEVQLKEKLIWLEQLEELTLSSLPKLENDTIDYKQLLHLDIKQKNKEVLPLEGQLQKVIAAIWSEILGVKIEDAKANFFDLGGHSIKAIQLISKINEKLHVAITMAQLFGNPVLYKFADCISDIKITTPQQGIESRGKKEFYPLSAAQRRIWTLTELEGQSKLYNILGIWKISGNIELKKLQDVLNILLNRHQSLRLGFRQVEGEPKMFEKEKARIPLDYIDFRGITSSLKEKTLEDLILQESNFEYNLKNGDLTRAKLIQVQEGEQILMIGQHHIISDGWSLNQLLEEITLLYQNINKELPEAPITYTDYVYWEQEQDITESKTYWLDRVGQYTDVLEFPTDKTRPALYKYEGDTQIAEVSKDLQNKLRIFAQKHQTSLYNVLFTAYATFVHKLTGKKDVLIGTPVAGRNHKDINDVVGMFVNTLPIRLEINDQENFEENLRKNAKFIQQDLAHDNYPFDKLLSEIDIERDLSRPPLIQTLFGFLSVDLSINLAGNKAEQIHVKHKISKFELSVQILDQKDKLAISFEYNTSLFKADTIAHWQQLFIQLLNQIIETPQKSLFKQTMLTADERTLVLDTFNETETLYPKDSTVYEQFAQQVNERPQAIAVQFENRSVTYAELQEKVSSWSGALQGQGVKERDVIAICTKSSIEQVIILLATQQLGAIYVPIDYEIPLERRQFILEDSNSKFLIIQPELIASIEWNEFPIIELREEPELEIQNELEIEKLNVTSSYDSYICYTSGSTGVPKGVVLPQKAILRLVKNTNYYTIKPEDRFMTVVNFAFDSFTFEFWGAILNGASYYVIPKEKILDLRFLSKFIEENGISVTFLTVTLFNQIIDQYPQCISTMKCVLVGGEELSVSHMRKALKYLPEGLYNGYGPTENTTFSNIYPIRNIADDQNAIPLGKPIANSKCYVLNEYLQPQPIGVIGEIYLTGEGLATKYLNQTKLTKELFIENPFIEGVKMYQSGDLGRWTNDGLLEYWGRKDTQVKIRGYRIECGEIEQVISMICKGKDAAVVVQVDSNGHKRLVAYYTENKVNKEQLIEALKKRLPSYMIPSAFMYLEELPKNAYSKLDRRNLPKIQIGKISTDIVLPKTELQKQLYSVWCEVLDNTTFGILDSFFDLGGDSITAVSLIGKLQRQNIPLDPKMIFMYPTISELSEVIESGAYKVKRTRTEKDYLIKLADGDEEKPRIYFLPPAGGTLMGYIELSRNLKHSGDIYGLQGPGLFEDETPQFLSYEQMLDIFELAITDHFRPGIDYFAGHSLGGHLAFGLTQRMERKGFSVKGVLILDTVPDLHIDTEEKVEMSQEELKMLALVLGMGHMVGMKPEDFKGMEYNEVKGIIIEKASEDETVKQFMDNEYLDKYLTIQINHMLLSQMMKLNPTPIDAPIAIFQTQFHIEDFMNRFKEWNKFTNIPMTIIPVEGNHVTMIRRPHVMNLGKRIDEVLLQVNQKELNEVV